MTKQVETATIVGTITLTGNATVVVTAVGLTGSPKTFSVAVTSGQTASQVAALVRAALAVDADIQAFFTVSGSGADVVLTSRLDASNDTTMNISSANGTCTGLTSEPTSANTTAGSADITNGYCTIDSLRLKGVMSDITAVAYDQILSKAINSVSRLIDARCGRFFFQTSLQTRYYTPSDHWRIYTADIASTSGLVLATDWNGDGVYETTWATTDYTLEPPNALVESPAQPYTMIRRQLYGNYYFPASRLGVSLTAIFGWPSVPAVIEAACILQCERYFNRLKTPLGSSAMSAFGMQTLKIPGLDPDVEDMLRPPYMKTV